MLLLSLPDVTHVPAAICVRAEDRLWVPHLSAKLAALGDDCHHALRLLDAPVVHIVDARRAVGKQRCDGKRHRRIWDVVAVVLDAAKLPSWWPCSRSS